MSTTTYAYQQSSRVLDRLRHGSGGYDEVRDHRPHHASAISPEDAGSHAPLGPTDPLPTPRQGPDGQALGSSPGGSHPKPVEPSGSAATAVVPPTGAIASPDDRLRISLDPWIEA